MNDHMQNTGHCDEPGCLPVEATLTQAASLEPHDQGYAASQLFAALSLTAPL
jgi:hypothetical protein